MVDGLGHCLVALECLGQKNTTVTKQGRSDPNRNNQAEKNIKGIGYLNVHAIVPLVWFKLWVTSLVLFCLDGVGVLSVWGHEEG